MSDVRLVHLLERPHAVLGEISRDRTAAFVVVRPRIDGDHALARAPARLGQRQHRAALPDAELDDERAVGQGAHLAHQIAELNFAGPAVDGLDAIEAGG